METPSQTLTHAWIWAAIDELARRNSLSTSGLARLSGLDPTAFNRSKRIMPDGRLRWPSTESIAKVLDATGTTLIAFAELQVTIADRPSGSAKRSVVPGAVNDFRPRGKVAKRIRDARS